MVGGWVGQCASRFACVVFPPASHLTPHHKPNQQKQNQNQVADALAQTSLFLAMLVRASNAFPLELDARDRAYHDSLLRAVTDVERVGGWALSMH